MAPTSSPSGVYCDRPIDVVFLLDRSDTVADIQQWWQTVDFVQQVLLPFDVTREGHPATAQRNITNSDAEPFMVFSRVALVSFSDTQSYDASWRDVDISEPAIFDLFGASGIKETELGGPSYIREAFEYLDSDQLDIFSGAHPRSDMVHRVIVVLTDGGAAAGHAWNGADAASFRLRNAVSIIAVGVGDNADRSQLNTLAGSTSGRQLSSMRPESVFARLNVSSPGAVLVNLRDALCPRCDADVSANCNRRTNCADVTSYDGCRATCCGLPAPPVGDLEQSDESADDIVSGFSSNLLLIVLLVVVIIMCCLMVCVSVNRRRNARSGQAFVSHRTPVARQSEMYHAEVDFHRRRGLGENVQASPAPQDGIAWEQLRAVTDRNRHAVTEVFDPYDVEGLDDHADFDEHSGSFTSFAASPTASHHQEPSSYFDVMPEPDNGATDEFDAVINTMPAVAQLHGKRFSFATAPDPVQTYIVAPVLEPSAVEHVQESNAPLDDGEAVPVRSLGNALRTPGDDDDEPDGRGGTYAGLMNLSEAELDYATAEEKVVSVGAGRRVSTVGPAFGGAVTHFNPLAALGNFDEVEEELTAGL